MSHYAFLALLLGLGIYELYALLTAVPGDTISEIVWTVSAKRPIVPFMLGLLMGHFFWAPVK